MRLTLSSPWPHSKLCQYLSRPVSSLLLVFAALAVVLSFYLWWITTTFLSPYLPSSFVSDGFGYYLSSKSFFINRSLVAPLIHLDKVSAVGDFYSHGFAYELLNGAAGIVFGWSDRIIIAVNITLASAAAILILLQKDILRSAILLLIVLTFYITPTMTLSYMQETIHILFAVIISFLFIRAAAAAQPYRSQAVMAIYAVLVLAALFRPLWLLWSVALPVLGRTKEEQRVYIGLAVLGLALCVTFLKLFYAPYPYYSPQEEMISAVLSCNFREAIYILTDTVSKNIAKLTSDDFYIFGKTRIPNLYTIATVFLNIYFIIRFRASQSRLFLAGFVVGTCYLGAVFLMYDTLAGARQLAAIFVMQMAFLTYAGSIRLVATIAVLQVILFPVVVTMTNHVLGFQLDAGLDAKRNSEEIVKLQQIGAEIQEGRRTTVYVDPKLSNVEFPQIIHYPLQSGDKYPIRYSLDVFASGAISQRVFKRGFIDYVLSSEPLDRQDLQPVYAFKDLFLYRLR